MATLHRATLTPTKLELLAAWLPQQDWYDGGDTVRQLAAFRLDDPAGEVGIEAILLDADGVEWLVPLTYRGEPLDGGAEHLLGEMEHSVLGTRYVYDGAGDPVLLDVLRATIEGAQHEADLVRDLGDGTTEPVEKSMTASGTGGKGIDIVLERRPQPAADADLADGSGVLIGRRGGSAQVLARLM